MPLYRHHYKNENISAIPETFTANDSISGYLCSASLTNSDNYPWKVWTQSYSTSEWTWWSGPVSLPQWIQIEVPAAFVPSAFMVMNEIASPLNMKSGVFQGSNNGSDWTDLYTISNWGNTAGYKETIELTTNTAYKYFRLYVTEGWQSDAGVSIQAMQIFRKEVSASGFDEFGHSEEYNSAKDAGCGGIPPWVDANTILYIPMYGDNPFADQSNTGYSLTNNGVTAVTNHAPAFAGGSGYFNGSAYLVNTSTSILSGLTTFCLEFDFMLDAHPSSDGAADGFYFMCCSGAYADSGVDFYFGSTGIIVSPSDYRYRHLISYSADINRWHRLKINRTSSGEFSVYVDGQLIGSVTDSSGLDTTANNFAIGICEPDGDTNGHFHGYMANYRISNIVR